MGARRDALRRAREEFDRLCREPPQPRPRSRSVNAVEPVELPTFRDAVRAARYHYLVQVMIAAQGQVSGAARIAGMNRTYFYKWLRKLGINPCDYRAARSIYANRAHRRN
jgi:two-component system response regulator GlrR